MRAAGVAGLESLPFYGKGIATDPSLGLIDNPIADLPHWNNYGFVTPAFKSLVKDALISAKQAEMSMDFALGCQAGHGVPSEPGTAGLALELFIGNATIFAGGDGYVSVTLAQQSETYIKNGLTFMLSQEPFGTANLTSVIAYELLNDLMINTGMGYSIPTGVLNESSLIDPALATVD
ncbi:hypothetical protein E8E12_000054, partial [Didymella heteroderae]